MSGAGTAPAPIAVDGYSGAATVAIDGREIAVTVSLRGFFQPVDGHYRWYGRIQFVEALHEAAGTRPRSIVLTTSLGHATARINDVDLWGRYRVAGVGQPPFPVEHVPTGAYSDNIDPDPMGGGKSC